MPFAIGGGDASTAHTWDFLATRPVDGFGSECI